MAKCIGCEKRIAPNRARMDDNGEIGCEACFTEDGSGDCPNRAALTEGARHD